MFKKAQVLHVQVPNVWSYFGNVVYFVTAGAGAVSLQSRQPTKPFGYDADSVGFETFTAENVGAGVKIFRASVPDWGFRVDYRSLIVDANGDAPAFFAKTKSRGGHLEWIPGVDTPTRSARHRGCFRHASPIVRPWMMCTRNRTMAMTSRMWSRPPSV